MFKAQIADCNFPPIPVFTHSLFVDARSHGDDFPDEWFSDDDDDDNDNDSDGPVNEPDDPDGGLELSETIKNQIAPLLEKSLA